MTWPQMDWHHVLLIYADNLPTSKYSLVIFLLIISSSNGFVSCKTLVHTADIETSNPLDTLVF